MDRNYEDEVQNEEDADLLNESAARRRKGWSRLKITIEPIKILLGFTIAFTSGATIDLLERNFCHQEFNLTYTQCMENMTNEMKSEIEAKTADVNMIINVLRGFFPLFFVFFIGPWSDINGRKPFMILSLIGFSVYYTLWGLFSLYPDLPAIYFFIPSVPLGLSGGMIVLFLCTWSYTSDNFEPEERPIRFSINGSCLIVGKIIGNALSGEVLRFFGQDGFPIIFFTSFVATLSALLYTIFVLEETIVNHLGIRTRVFDLNHIRSVFMVMLIRPTKGVLLSVLVIAILLTEIPAGAGDDAIAYLIGQSQYHWSLSLYNLYAAISSVIAAVSPVLGIWLFVNLVGASTHTIMVFSSAFMVLAQVLKALSQNQIMYWIFSFAAKASTLVGPCVDTELANIVSNENMGKAFTMMSLVDTISPVISIPVYSQVYKLFLPGRTLYVYFVSAILAFLCLLSCIGLFFKQDSANYRRASTIAIND